MVSSCAGQAVPDEYDHGQPPELARPASQLESFWDVDLVQATALPTYARAGEAPPELSPLDAFALQSRLLARQLQESNRDGNRVSRLPPLTVESPLIQQGRSDYFRSMSYEPSDADESPELDNSGLGLRTAVEEAFTPEERPRSMHPRMSQIPPTPDDSVPVPLLPDHARDLSRGVC